MSNVRRQKAPMDNALTTAIVAAASAVFGGLLTAVVGPAIKHRLEEGANKAKRRQEKVAEWRQMLLEVHQTSGGDADPSEHLFLHPAYASLEPYLTDEARRELQSEGITIVQGQGLAYPLELLKTEIARIEALWELRT